MRGNAVAEHNGKIGLFEIAAQKGSEILERVVGGLGGILARGDAVFVKIGAENAEIAVILVGGLIANRAVERFHHVKTREVGREFDVGKQVSHGVAE